MKPTRSDDGDRRYSWLIGILCLAVAILADRLFLEHLIVADGKISSRALRWLLAIVEVGGVCSAAVFFVVRPRVRPGILILTGTASILSLVLGEVVLRTFYEVPQQTIGWRSSAPAVERNQLGYRGRPIEYHEGDFVVLFVGDSQVEAKACAYTWMPERRLEHHLRQHGKRARVFSVGASGYGQGEQLLAMREYFAKGYRADVVIVWLTPGNDLVDNTFASHWRGKSKTPKPTFWLENGALRGPSEELGDMQPTVSIRSIALLDQLLMIDRDWEWAKHLPPPYVPMEHYDGSVEKRVHGYGFEASIGKQVLSEDRTAFSMMLKPRSPRIQYGVDLTVKLLEEMRNLTVAHKGELVTFRANDGLDLPGPHEYVQEFFGKYYHVSNQEYHNAIEDIMRGSESYSVPVTLEDWAVGPEDGHLNEHAVDEAMAGLAGKLTGSRP